MADCHKLVMEFHDIYEVPIGECPQGLSLERLSLRLGLIGEEFFELLQAADAKMDHHLRLIVFGENQDIVEMADALGDIVYVCFGMAIEMGIDLNRVMHEIQRVNKSKLGEDGKPIRREDGKVLKGPNYQPPNIAQVLFSQTSVR